MAERGDACGRGEIVTRLGKSRSAVADWLAILRDHGLISATGERGLVGEAAGGDPHVVDRTRVSALGGCGQAPSNSRYRIVAR